MKKIILTEKQIKKLKIAVLNEQVPAVRASEHPIDSGRYHQAITCKIVPYRSTYKGGEINDIADVKFNVSYLIDVDHESHGITDIIIYDIRGPKEIKTTIDYYPWEDNPDDDTVEELIIIPLDWHQIQIEKDYEMEYFGVDPDVTLYVVNDGNNGLKMKQIEIIIKQF